VSGWEVIEVKVLIAGGGNVGSFIARELAGDGHTATIIEIDRQRVDGARGTPGLEGVSWIVGDACEVSELALAAPEAADVVVAATGDDEDNLVISLLAKQEFGVPRVIGRVNNPDNQWLFNESWGIDVAVSTPHLLTSLVEEAVSVGSLVRLMSLAGDRAGLFEVNLASDSPAAGRSVEELRMPRGSSVVAVLRDRNVIVPRGDTVLAAGDEVLVLTTSDTEAAVRSLLIAE
jgi:trk system potassium uptake protein TrkA